MDKLFRVLTLVAVYRMKLAAQPTTWSQVCRISPKRTACSASVSVSSRTGSAEVRVTTNLLPSPATTSVFMFATLDENHRFSDAADRPP